MTELYHKSSKCPGCGIDCASPFRLAHDSTAKADHLFCPSCGHDWTEEDIDAIAKAWFSSGAWEQKQREASDLTSCEKCGFVWQPKTLKEDHDVCRDCEAARHHDDLMTAENELDDCRDMIREHLGGPENMPSGLKYAVQILIQQATEAEQRGDNSEHSD